VDSSGSGTLVIWGENRIKEKRKRENRRKGRLKEYKRKKEINGEKYTVPTVPTVCKKWGWGFREC
jgi:hypothetical protein